MNCIKFDLTGEMACFRKPETNSSVYLTFSNIHKVALLGLLGSIIGLKGYNQTKEKEFPEFYRLLKDFKIAIETPKCNKLTQVNTFNNSTGIASQQDGGNQIVKENILLNPKWTIYIMENDTLEYQKLKDYLQNKKCKFIPYLGRNDYFANIENVEILELEENFDTSCTYDSLVNASFDDIVKDNTNKLGLLSKANAKNNFLHFEKLPIQLDKETFHYVYKDFLLTSDKVIKKPDTYNCNNKILQFI